MQHLPRSQNLFQETILCPAEAQFSYVKKTVIFDHLIYLKIIIIIC